MKATLHYSALTDNKNHKHPLTCCGMPMDNDGGCADDCCDDFKCAKCGRELRVEWPD